MGKLTPLYTITYAILSTKENLYFCNITKERIFLRFQLIFYFVKEIENIFSVSHLTIRARNVYEVIVNEGEARVNYRFIEIESE